MGRAANEMTTAFMLPERGSGHRHNANRSSVSRDDRLSDVSHDSRATRELGVLDPDGLRIYEGVRAEV